MDADLLARIDSLKASRRAGATPQPTDKDVEWLNAWTTCIHFSEIDSTQSYVEREHASFDQDKLTVVSADFQTAGRGTRDRTWQALQAQSALMTFFFRFPVECKTEFVNRNAPNVTQVLAVSAVETLRSVVEGQEGLKFGVKWPNDIILNDKKIGGILARAEPSPGPRLDRIIVGIGVNINTPQDELDKIHRPVWPATSLTANTGNEATYDVADFRAKLASNFAACLRKFFIEGFTGFRERFNSLDVHLEKEIRFRVAEETILTATYLGINDSGHIMLRQEDGKVGAFPSGEIVQEPATSLGVQEKVE